MALPLEGKIAVVTGAARGLGQAYARMLASRGADIAIGDRLDASETVAMVQAEGRRAFAAEVDLSRPDEVERFAASVGAALGDADILVSNAGVAEFGSFEDITWESWRHVLGSNLDAGFLCARAFEPAMRDKGWGRLIFVSSNTAWTNSPMFAHYVASKLGVVGLTRALASEFGAHGITANAIAPSIVPTPMTIGSPAEEMFPKYRDELQAIHRQETPEDLALVVAFLASDDSRFITGQTLAVDGGVIRL